MKIRAELLVSCAALAIAVGFASPSMAADMVTKAPVAIAPAWWYEGYAEIGYRFNANNTDRTKLGRFYRYEDWSPGVFGNFFVGAHRSGADPFDIEAWGKNVGWDDQAFGLDIYQPGTYYLSFGWDQTPHNYGFDAKTTFSGIGGNTLSSPTYGAPAGAQAVVNANTNIFDLGIRRDTATAKGRWTPDDNWDINVGYTHLHRDGTQALSTENTTQTAPPAPPASPNGTGTRTSIQLPKPVDDTTHNAEMKAEYTGSSPWGKPFNVALGYAFSKYDDQVGCGTVAGTNAPPSGTNCLTYNNPWVAASSGANSFWNRYGLWPDNQAHTMNLTGGVGLPFNSRYMGTVQYTWMTQDEAFLPSTINPALPPAALSRSSLGGDARTLLSNNVFNTQITSELTSNLRYRYYDYHSNTSPMTITGVWNRPDSNTSANTANPAGTTTATAFPTNFTKQNLSEEMVYRPWKWLDLGAAYEWESFKHVYGGDSDEVVAGTAGVATTNEYAGKAFFDAKWGWSTLRSSVRFSERRLDGAYINPSDAAAAFRNIDLQNRDSTIAKSSWDIVVTEAITFTPTGGFRRDTYPADGVSTDGISLYQSWNAGADVSWVITPMATIYVSYSHEDGIRDVFTNPTGSLARTTLASRDLNDVIVFGGKYTAIPDKLFLNATYTFSKGTSRWDQDCGPSACASTAVYPDTHNTNHRIDAWAKYMLDPTIMRNAGFFADAKPFVKARVVWERNSNDSWQNIDQQLGWALPGADATLQRAIFLGMSDPNYNVVVGMLSFGVKW